jgi:hypothetical protein
MDAIDLIGSTMGLGFLAGIRLYGTVLALGLAIRFNLLHLTANTESLRILAHPAVLIVAGIAYLAEFFMDKIPWVDSVWNAFHTVIRPVGAALIAAAALGHMDPVFKITLILLCGGVAFASHGSKSATRLLVNHSPEPFSNIGMSLLGDAMVPAGVWMTLKYPIVVLVIVSIFLVAFVWLIPKVVRSLRRQFSAIAAWFREVMGENSSLDIPREDSSHAYEAEVKAK